jgi:4-amino-4-deoxy-L-arabinose transferase-like glycosyltransferase
MLNTFKNKHFYFYLFSIAIFIAFISPFFLAEGMFLDGVLYSAIANNLSLGLGDFWHLHYTQTLYSEFNEHPPLAIGIQSVFHRVFGVHYLVEKFYSLFCIVISGFLIVKIWFKLLPTSNFAWLPLLFWTLIPLVTWCANNNLLENTMGIFILLALWFCLKSFEINPIFYLFLTGFSLSLAFLCKGFTSLFLWTFPLVYGLIVQKQSFPKAVLATFYLFIFTLLPLFLLFYFYPESWDSFQKYFNRQIIGSLEHPQTPKSRFYILSSLLTELLIPLALCLIVFISSKKLKLTFQKNQYLPKVLAFLLVGLSGVLPIMISQKQSGYYIFCTFPFFVFSLSFLILPIIESLFSKFSFDSKFFRFFKAFTLVFLGIALIFTMLQINKIGRNKEMIKMIHSFTQVIPPNSVISIPKSLWEDWSLRAYFARYANISLDSDGKYKTRFYLAAQALNLPDYHLIRSSDSYFLYQVK